MQFSSLISASLALLAAQVQARAIEQARQLPGGLGGVTGGLPGLGGATGGLPGLGGATGGLPGLGGATGGLPGLGGATGGLGGVTGGLTGLLPGSTGAEPKTDTTTPPATGSSSTGNTYYCCSTAPGENPSLAAIVANVNCPQIPVLNIVNFFDQCSTDNHRVTCDPSQSGESNDGLLNSQCTVNVPIQIN